MHTTPTQLAVIDSSLPEGQALARALPDNAAVCWLEPTQNDGLATIAQRLAMLDEPCSALHLITHGAPGLLALGHQLVRTVDLAEHAEPLAAIGAHLADDATIYLYGCEVGAGPSGREFIETLSRLVGAHVQAASHVIGGAIGWDLDVWTALRPATEALHFPAYTSTLAVITTGAGNDVVPGTTADDTIDGGAGADTMAGGLGNDTYVRDNTGDVVLENIDEGIDTVLSAINYTLAANLERLTLTGAATNGGGNALNNLVTGNALANLLAGAAGNDTLDGGTGADTLIGGTGNDTYYRDNTGDVLTENAAEGTDTVISSLNYTLGANLENVTLAGSATNAGGNTLNNVMTGNALANLLVGAAGNDTLDGSTGADTLVGGIGNDTYYRDNAGDVLNENAAEGTDTVISSLNYTLGANLENVTLTGSATNTGGNDLANTMTGNALNNLLFGAAGNDSLVSAAGNDTLDGGLGADTLLGGSGNDSYTRDNAGDVITEAAGEGTDTVTTSVNYTLAANVENLVLVGSATNGGGNELDNVLTGNTLNNLIAAAAGNDTIDGGDGADVMIGGTGNDTYYHWGTGDVITEYVGEGTDTVITRDNYTLAANLENLTLSATATNGGGNALDNVLTGNALNNLLAGAGGNDTLDGGAGVDTLAGGYGGDAYFRDNTSDVVNENIAEGTDTVTTSVNYTLGANLENLVLAGTATNGGGNALNNVITGNALNNLLAGADGHDTFIGGAGADTMIGGIGNDVYYCDSTADIIIEGIDGYNDTVFASANYTLSSNIEELWLMEAALNGAGNASDNRIVGNALNNVLTGGAGNDTLEAGIGSDTLIGGQGDDTYYRDNANDSIIENAGEGIDSVTSTVDYTLADNVEKLWLGTYYVGDDYSVIYGAQTGAGNALDNEITGNLFNNALNGASGNDTLFGGEGNDTLDGGAGNDYLSGGIGGDSLTAGSGDDTMDGGAGSDTLSGGTGNDVYGHSIFDDTVPDLIIENAGEGIDKVISFGSYTLGANIENLDVSGNGIGNELDNLIVATAAHVMLQGGAGNDTLEPADTYSIDTLIGGTGDDRYTVNNDLDVVTENANEGTDTVISSRSYRLGADVENLILENYALDAVAGTGNELANSITGNDRSNTLNGAAGNDTLLDGTGDDTLDGGTGNDTMAGGIGNDTYLVDSASDVITENVAEGTDTVSSAVNYTLGDNVENLLLAGTATDGGGNGLNNALTGNALNNALTGAAGNDTLTGGLGNDALLGGDGIDTFVFDTALNAGSNVDTIMDFTANDLIALDNDVFTSLGAFYSGAGLTGGTSASQGPGIYYDTTSGSLYYDADGNGGATGVMFALVNGAPALTGASFVVVD